MKRIPPVPILQAPSSEKDANGIYVKASPVAAQATSVTPDPPTSDVDLDDLQDKVRLILFREIKNLTINSASGLLSREESQSLVNYAKLLTDLKEAEDKALSRLTDEDLEK